MNVHHQSVRRDAAGAGEVAGSSSLDVGAPLKTGQELPQFSTGAGQLLQVFNGEVRLR
jgi:hypothetical protein